MRLLEGNQWSSGMTIEGYTPKPDETDEHAGQRDQSRLLQGDGHSAADGTRLRSSATSAPRRRRTAARPATASRSSTSASRSTTSATGNPIGRRIGFGSDPGHADADRDRRRRARLEVHGCARRDAAPGLLPVSRAARAERLHRLRAHDSAARSRSFGADPARCVRQLDPNLPIHGTRTLETQVEQSLQQRAAGRDDDRRSSARSRRCWRSSDCTA